MLAIRPSRDTLVPKREMHLKMPDYPGAIMSDLERAEYSGLQ